MRQLFQEIARNQENMQASAASFQRASTTGGFRNTKHVISVKLNTITKRQLFQEIARNQENMRAFATSFQRVEKTKLTQSTKTKLAQSTITTTGGR